MFEEYFRNYVREIVHEEVEKHFAVSQPKSPQFFDGASDSYILDMNDDGDSIHFLTDTQLRENEVSEALDKCLEKQSRLSFRNISLDDYDPQQIDYLEGVEFDLDE